MIQHPRRPGFTLIELLVVIAVIAVLIAMLVPAVQKVREAAARTQCANNLHQLGIAIHNFHDVKGGIPPASTGNIGLTFWAIILPYIEQQSIYEKLNIEASGGADACTAADHIGAAAAAGSTANYNVLKNARVSTFVCPTRRATNAQNNYNLPVGDYAIIISGPERWVFGSTSVKNQTQAMRVATVPFTNFEPAGDNLNYISNGPVASPFPDPNKGWRPRDKFKTVGDGLSNTIFIGEKHITPNFLGRCCRDNHGPEGRDGYLYWNRSNGNPHYGEYWIAGSADLGIARSPFEGEGLQVNAAPALGSWHSGMCNFLFGDGTVRAIEVSVSSQVLINMAARNDGKVFDLPP